VEFNYFEYTVSKKSEGTYKLLRGLMVLFYVVYVVGFFSIIFVLKAIPVGALIPVTLWILVFFTWRFVSVEYRYEVDKGRLIFSEIYGGKKSRVKAEFRVHDVVLLAPVGAAASEIENFAPERVFDASPSVSSPDRYVLLIRDETGVKTAFYLQANEKAAKAIRFYMTPEAKDASDAFED